MEKLMKPAEYAKELGISRQAVYAKIKRGILTAKNVEGKLYIVIDTEEKTAKEARSEPVVKREASEPVKKKNTGSAVRADDFQALLAAKDETIEVLKGTVKDLKKSNKQISTTLRGEIDLLKDAFHEMRTLYRHQLEHKKAPEAIDVVEEEREESVEVVEERWISIKKFFKKLGVKKEKKQEKIEKRLKKALKSGDERLSKQEGKLKLNVNKNYDDLLK